MRNGCNRIDKIYYPMAMPKEIEMDRAPPKRQRQLFDILFSESPSNTLIQGRAGTAKTSALKYIANKLNAKKKSRGFSFQAGGDVTFSKGLESKIKELSHIVFPC